MTKIELIKFAIENLTKGEQWIDKIPQEINEAFFDNPYTAANGVVMDAALKTALGEDLYEDVMWWLYDGKNQVAKDGKTVISINKDISVITYCLKCDADYYSYLEQTYALNG